MRQSLRILLAFGVTAVWPATAPAVVISEIYYHPAVADEELEFIELAADTGTPEDISGYAFTGGISFVFPPGSIVGRDTSIVVCANADAVRAHYDIENALGNYTGRLDNSGERLTLVNQVGIEVLSLRYQDDGKWPTAPDGSGHSLILRRNDLDPTEPESWTWSPELGGSPGRENTTPEPGSPRDSIVFNELLRGTEAGEGWVELFNSSAEEYALNGHRLIGGAPLETAYVFPDGTSISARGHLVIEASSLSLPLAAGILRLFLANAKGEVIAATVFDRAPPPATAAGEFSELRFPDGGPLVWVSPTPTPGGPNVVPRETRIVINEIFYHPPEDRRGEFVELYNRSSETVDLSGFSFSKGIDYTIHDGTQLAAGEYLVVAEDPVLLVEHYGVLNALGPYQGSLADAGENVRLLDRARNLVDEVRYFDGGTWSRWADGGGASLELIDPTQENDFASAWAASDESDKTAWEMLSYTAVGVVPTEESELHLYAAERGECLLDDISIVPAGGGNNYIPNPSFEASLDDWAIDGTHIQSERVTTSSHTGEAALLLVASGKGDELCNRLEVETSPTLAAGNYEVSLWARWQRGTSLLVAHGEASSGPTGALATDALGARLRMTVPWNLGTPGAENSARRLLQETAGHANLGPVIGGVQHLPVAPLPDTPPQIQAHVSDADGVTTVRVHYRTGEDTIFATAELFDDGAHSDGRPDDSLFAGELPGYPRGTRVSFYIEAVDSAGNVRSFPRQAPERRLVYVVESFLDPPVDVYRLTLEAESELELASRALHSNHPLDGTLVYNNDEIFYQVGVRYRGSPWGRPGRKNRRVRLPRNRRFVRGRRGINLESSGLSPNEGAAYFMVGRHGTPEHPTPAAEYLYGGYVLNGGIQGIYGIIEPVGRPYIEKWYGANAADEAVVFKGVGRFAFDDGCGMRGIDGATLIHKGNETESYRGYWLPSIHRTRDNWESFFELTEVMDWRHTPDDLFDARVGEVLDVEAFLRVIAIRMLLGGSDALFISAGHNGYVARNPNDGQWEYLAFDMDSSFNEVETFFPGDPYVSRLLSRPEPRRIYLRILAETVTEAGYWSLEKAGPYLDAIARDTTVKTTPVKAVIERIATQVREATAASTELPLRISNPMGPDGIVAEDAELELIGEAPVQVVTLLARFGASPAQTLELTWTSATEWRATLSTVFPTLDGGAELELLGVDRFGAIVRTVTAQIVRAGSTSATFVRGDASGNGSVNIIDVIRLLGFLFREGEASCVDALDVDDDGAVRLPDAIAALDFLFRGGAPPPPPFPDSGRDPTEDTLGCSS